MTPAVDLWGAIEARGLSMTCCVAAPEPPRTLPRMRDGRFVVIDATGKRMFEGSFDALEEFVANLPPEVLQ